MLIYQFVLTLFSQNTRIIIDEISKKGAVIDPGGDTDALFQALESSEIHIETVILTHGHLDHAGGVEKFRAEYARRKSGRKPRLLAHKGDLPLLKQIEDSARFFQVTGFEDCPEPDRFVEAGEILEIGTLSATVLHVPGHSPGSIALYFKEMDVMVKGEGRERKFKAPVVIVGDALFKGSIGRTDLPGGNHAVLLRSIRENLFALPDETVVMSGHGPDTTIGYEKQTNPFLA